MQSITLELMRHGPDHNQLLSPATAYLAVCENAPVCTVHVPFEHEQLLARLASLTYPAHAVPQARRHAEQQRDFQVSDLGRQLGEMLAAVPGLAGAAGLAHADPAASGIDGAAARRFLHLRLVLSAQELALLPFELAVGQPGLPGLGQHLALQLALPLCLTRESRRAARRWYRSPPAPRILFAWCDAGGPVPARDHGLALREALDPWLQHDSAGGMARFVDVLPNASLAELSAACRRTRYSHVHLLAHGMALDPGHSTSFFAIGLRADSPQPDGSRLELVTGRNLARALAPLSPDRADLHQPMVVTLASCDSGASQAVPLSSKGDSIAHALHEAGIPLVVASQFPLSFLGSVVMVRQLYRNLLAARDPRLALIDTRHELARAVPGMHDWASLVCYLSLPPDFERSNVRTEVDRLNDALYRGNLDCLEPDADPTEVQQRFEAAFERLQRFELGASARAEDQRSLHSLNAGLRRRHGQWLYARHAADPARADQHQADVGLAVAEFRRALGHYLAAYDAHPQQYWTLTEATRLSLLVQAIDSSGPDAAESGRADERGGLPLPPRRCWRLLRNCSLYDLHNGCRADRHRAWTLVDAIEIAVLGCMLHHDQAPRCARLAGQALELAQDLRDLAPGPSYAVTALRKQLQRYASPPFNLIGPAESAAARLVAQLALQVG